MKKFYYFPCVIAISCLVLLPALFSSARAESISWTGCGISKKAFMDKLSKVYTEKTGVKFRLSGGGATKGVRLSSSGTTDLGGSCRHRLSGTDGKIIPEEANAKMFHIAWDALVVIVHKNNPVENLTMDQVKRIFTGQIKNWTEVGGKDQEIMILARQGKVSGVGYMFRLLVMGNKDFEFPGTAKLYKSSGPVEKNIESRFENSIGITGVSSAKKRQVKILKVDGVTPDKDNTASGKYPYFRPLFLVASQPVNSQTQKFIDFALSTEGQKVISDEGTVNLTEGAGLYSLITHTEVLGELNQ